MRHVALIYDAKLPYDLKVIRGVAQYMQEGAEFITYTEEDALKNQKLRRIQVKQSYNLEDIWVLKYQRLKYLVVLVTAAAYFAATFLGQQMKLRILTEKLLIISQRFFGVSPFRFYALADGIRRVLSRSTFLPPQETSPDAQLELALVSSA